MHRVAPATYIDPMSGFDPMSGTDATRSPAPAGSTYPAGGNDLQNALRGTDPTGMHPRPNAAHPVGQQAASQRPGSISPTSPDLPWVSVSPRYRDLKHRMVLIVWGIEFAVLAAALGIVLRWWLALVVLAVALPWIWYRYQRVDKVYRALAYAERDTDLYVRHGILFRRLTAVPYGRMQVVEVASGPIERHFGLATVKLVTASASTDATIPGLEAAAAADLRERLTEKGEHQAAGL